MHHSFTKQCVIVGSALLLGLACAPLNAQTTPKPRKALLQLDSLMSRLKPGEKSDDQPQHVDEAPQRALIPPGSILNRQPLAEARPTTSTPLPPTSLVLGQSPVVPVAGVAPAELPSGSRIETAVPASTVAQAQLLATQLPVTAGQSPIIIVMPGGVQPGTVNFAPREISPEVPGEFWPVQSRNPLGRGESSGLFTWPKFAKSVMSETDGSSSEPPTTENQNVQMQSSSKALFARSQRAAQPVAQEYKALLAPSDRRPPVAADNSQQPRALFARSQTTPAPVAQVNDGSKPRALFAFGRKPAETTPVAPVPTLAQPVADASSISIADKMPAIEAAGETPPAAPTLAQVKSAPRVEKGPDLKWRAKGSPRATLVNAETASPDKKVMPVETTPVMVDEQAASGGNSSNSNSSAAISPSEPTKPVTSAPVTSQGDRQARHRALLSPALFGRGSRKLETSAVAQSGGQSQMSTPDAVPAPASTPKAMTNEKAILPNLMAMVSRVKQVAVDSDATDAPIAASSVTTESHIASPHDLASARSYYAPAVEYVSRSECTCKKCQQDSCDVSHRKIARSEKCEADAVDSFDASIVREENPADTVARKPQVQQPHHGATHQAARPAKRKGYRKLTLQDLTAGLFRPLRAINELTKLPGSKHEPAHHDAPPAPPMYDVPAVEKQVVRRPPPIPMDIVESEVESVPHPDVSIAEPMSRSLAATPRMTEDHSPEVVTQPTVDAVLASDSDATEPARLRSGRRQVTVPEIALKDVGERATAGLGAMRIRNSSGASVLIFSGNKLAVDGQTRDESTDRDNPLR